MYFSYSVIFSFLAIFQVLQCAFLIFHVFQGFRHFSSLQVDVSHFPWFSVSCHIPCATVDISKLSNFLSFPRLISRPKVCISHLTRFSVFTPYSRSNSVHFWFSNFSVISLFYKSSSGCFSFSLNFSYLDIIHILQWTFLNFPPSSVFLAIFHVLMCVFLIFGDFQFSSPFPGSIVCISHFSRFSEISSFFKSSSECFSVSRIFSFLPYSMSYSGHF